MSEQQGNTVTPYAPASPGAYSDLATQSSQQVDRPDGNCRDRPLQSTPDRD